MKIPVTEKGLIIPKELLEGVKEVEIHKENNKISIVALEDKDTIFNLGKSPVSCSVNDSSVNHDKYIYEKTS